MLSSFDGNRAPNTVAGQKLSIQSGNIQVVHLEASGGKVPMRACARYSRRMPDFVHALHCVTVDFTKWQDPCGIDTRTGPMAGKLSRAQSHCRQFRALALGFIGTRDHVFSTAQTFLRGSLWYKKTVSESHRKATLGHVSISASFWHRLRNSIVFVCIFVFKLSF